MRKINTDAHKKTADSGFAVLEVVVVIAVLAFVGLGTWFFLHRQAENKTAAGQAPLGTTARAAELETNGANDEENADSSFDTQQETNAASDDSALNNMSGAADASNL